MLLLPPSAATRMTFSNIYVFKSHVQRQKKNIQQIAILLQDFIFGGMWEIKLAIINLL